MPNARPWHAAAVVGVCAVVIPHRNWMVSRFQPIPFNTNSRCVFPKSETTYLGLVWSVNKLPLSIFIVLVLIVIYRYMVWPKINFMFVCLFVYICRTINYILESFDNTEMRCETEILSVIHQGRNTIIS